MNDSAYTPLAAEQLRVLHCRHMTGADRLSDGAILAQLQALPHWEHHDGAIRRTFQFQNFHETMAFLNAIAWFLHRQDHHPDMQVGYNTATLAFSTHSANGITLNDFICAARIDEVYGL